MIYVVLYVTYRYRLWKLDISLINYIYKLLHYNMIPRLHIREYKTELVASFAWRMNDLKVS